MRFYVNKVRNEYYVNADARWNNLRVRVSVFRISTPDNFIKTKNNERLNSKEKVYSQRNEELKRVRSAIDNYIANLNFKNKSEGFTINDEDFKRDICLLVHPNNNKYALEEENGLEDKESVETKKISFIERYKEFVKYKKELDGIAKSTDKRYVETLNKLLAFQDYYGLEINFESIDLDFYKKFLHYMANVHVNERTKEIGICDNSAANSIKNLKTFLRWALKKGYHNNAIFLDGDFKTKKERDTDVIALNEQELAKIFELDLSKNRKLERIRDLFIVQVHTMLRVSDLLALERHHLDFENELIYVYTKKTDDRIKIPMTPQIKEILTKYNYRLPKISSQKYNEHLKELGKLAGLDAEVEISRKQGSGSNTVVYKKYELLSSHVARRSGITSLIRRGVPPKLIMQISGHKKLAVFEKYIKLTDDEAINAVKSAWINK